MYFSPVIREARYKNDCINNSKKGLLSIWKNNEAEKDIEEKSGLPVEGFGIQEFPNGQVYKGDWKNNMKHGVGEDTYAAGDRYLGEFENNMPSGRGTMYWSNGDIFRGLYEWDVREGYGQYTFADGNSFTCEFVEGKCPGRKTSTVDLDNQDRTD